MKRKNPAPAAPAFPIRNLTLEARLRDAAGDLRIGRWWYAFHTVSSTMDLARRLADVGAPDGTCIWAEVQTAGRGRAGRRWLSPKGGLYLSIVVQPTRPPAQLPPLALVAGLAAAKAVKEATGLRSAIRWPNDLLLKGKKLAGILIESRASVTGVDYAVLGIGLNVTADRRTLPGIATALDQHVNPVPDRVTLAITLCKHLQRLYDQWAMLGFGVLRKELSAWLWMRGRPIRIQTERGTFKGKAVDVDESGRLVVRLANGIRAFDAGEVCLLQ